jgi:hypothetical protein
MFNCTALQGSETKKPPLFRALAQINFGLKPGRIYYHLSLALRLEQSKTLT